MYSIEVYHPIYHGARSTDPTIRVDFMIDKQCMQTRMYHPHEWPLMGMRIRDWVEEGKIGS